MIRELMDALGVWFDVDTPESGLTPLIIVRFRLKDNCQPVPTRYRVTDETRHQGARGCTSIQNSFKIPFYYVPV